MPDTLCNKTTKFNHVGVCKRRHVCVVGDSATLSSYPFLEKLVEYASEVADYRVPEVRSDTLFKFNLSAEVVNLYYSSSLKEIQGETVQARDASSQLQHAADVVHQHAQTQT